MAFAMQRLGKKFPRRAPSNIEHPLLGNGQINEFSMWFVYIHCWAMDVFSMDQLQNYIITPVANKSGKYKRLKLGGGQAYDRSSD
jgi:hypothetical protein